MREYFCDYLIEPALYFQYGMEQVIAETRKVGSDTGPVFITNKMEMPYIYALFFDRYPLELFQRGPVDYVPGEPGSSLYAGVAHFDRDWFKDPQWSYRMMPRGVFVFPGDQESGDSGRVDQVSGWKDGLQGDGERGAVGSRG